MANCEGRKVGYLSPWDREQGNAPYDLVCQLEAGHEGYHVDQDRLPFGPYLLSSTPACTLENGVGVGWPCPAHTPAAHVTNRENGSER